jgi:serine/threonine protein kinase
MGDGQDDRLDVWCLGVLTYELLFLRSPFPNKDLEQKIKKLDYEIPVSSGRHEDEDLVDMFKKIFCYKDKRIRAH